MGKKDHKKKADLINNIEREFGILEEGAKVEIHLDALKTTRTKIPNWVTTGEVCIHWYYFKIIYIYDRLAPEMNKCIQKIEVQEWRTKGRTILIQKTNPKEPPETTRDS